MALNRKMKIGVIVESFRSDFRTGVEKAAALGAAGIQAPQQSLQVDGGCLGAGAHIAVAGLIAALAAEHGGQAGASAEEEQQDQDDDFSQAAAGAAGGPAMAAGGREGAAGGCGASAADARAAACAAHGTGPQAGAPPSDGLAGAGHILLPSPGSVLCHKDASCRIISISV